MVSAVQSRPNHYETLGLKPGATAEQIARAFAKKMSLTGAQLMGGAAQVCVAYETLRDPIKRRDYDRAIGLEAKSQSRQWTMAAPQPRWSPFIASATPKPALRPAGERGRPVEAPVPLQARPEAGAEPKLAAIVETLRELAKPAAIEASCDARPEQAPTTPETSEFVIEPDMRQLLAARRVEDGGAEDDSRQLAWKGPVLAVAGLVAAAGAIGAVAGLSVRDGQDTAQAAPSVTSGIPKAKPHPATAESPIAMAEAVQSEGQRPLIATSVARSRHPIATHPPASPSTQHLADSRPAEVGPAEVGSAEVGAADDAFVESATGQAAEAASTEAISAGLPLPNEVVARTIERIGYACGEVASATAVDGAAGVFKITCSSGQVYRAAPSRGRYHFRRWSGE